MELHRISDPLSPGFVSDWAMDAPYHREEDRAERYFFFAGDVPGFDAPGGMSVHSDCIPERKLPRCRIVPCFTRMRRARVEEIPEGRVIPGTLVGRYAETWLFSGPEAEQILYEYGNLLDYSRNWGLIELEEMRGWNAKRVQALDLNTYFFPDYPNIPSTNAGILQHLKEVQDRIRKDGTVDQAFYSTICEKMIVAVKAAEAYQQRSLDKANADIQRPSGEPNRKEQFDPRDYLFSERTGMALASRSTTPKKDANVELMEKILLALTAKEVTPSLTPEMIVATVAAAIKTTQSTEDVTEIPSDKKKKKSEVSDKTDVVAA